MMNGEQQREENVARVLIVVVVIALTLAICFGGLFGYKWFTRYQRVQDAHNEIAVNQMKIQQTRQLVLVENQKAAIRVAEAHGIAQAQEIINATLTDRYLQHEAIQAQMRMAGSPNHTQIYIPVGNNGIPLVKTVE
jgi:hypothetical protein